MSQVSSSITIERPTKEVDEDGEFILEEIEVEISGGYQPFRRGAFERGGLQIDPDDPESIEDIEATHEGKVIELTKAEMEKAEEALLEAANEVPDYEPDYD